MLWLVGTMPDNVANDFHFPTGDEQLVGSDKIVGGGRLQSEIFQHSLALA